MSLILDGSNGITFPNSSTQAVGFYGFKNRIINGGMNVNQYNVGTVAAVDGVFPIDRWRSWQNSGSGSKGNMAVNLNSAGAPIGFQNYLGFQTTSAYSVSGTDAYGFQHRPEGQNMADLLWGTANAKAATLSFYVYSSLTGTFGGSIRDTAGTASYPFSYTVSSANTWTSVTINVLGPTIGTWGTGNGVWGYINLSYGAASSVSGTAGAWSASSYWSATGAVSVVSTNSATFYFAGVQLEAGSTATSFDYRPYNTELALCQRYYETYALFYNNESLVGMCESTTAAYTAWKFVVTKRAAPTCATFGTVQVVSAVGSGLSLSSFSFTNTNPDQARINAMTNSASLVAGNATNFYTTTSTSPYGGFTASAEL